MNIEDGIPILKKDATGVLERHPQADLVQTPSADEQCEQQQQNQEPPHHNSPLHLMEEGNSQLDVPASSIKESYVEEKRRKLDRLQGTRERWLQYCAHNRILEPPQLLGHRINTETERIRRKLETTRADWLQYSANFVYLYNSHLLRQRLERMNIMEMPNSVKKPTSAGTAVTTSTITDPTNSTASLIESMSANSTEATLSVPGAGSDAKQRSLFSIYCNVWMICTIVALILNILNTKWHIVIKEEWWKIMLTFMYLALETLLNWSSMELPLKSIFSLLVKSEDSFADGHDLSVIINYNLLASDEAEVDVAFQNALKAYTGNLSPFVVSVLISATGDKALKTYELETRDRVRESIFELILAEGRSWANGTVMDEGRASRCFEMYRNHVTGEINHDFIENTLPALADKYSKDFMLVQRVTRALRKCGQYQDLLLLNEGCNEAWTYTDDDLYVNLARTYGEYLFYPSEDVENIKGRRIEYTLVLDLDTGVTKDSLTRLMDIAAANPNRAIIQPSIQITADKDQSLFMHIDRMRQEIHEPVTAAFSTLLGRCGFYGKGLLKNELYIETMLGTEETPLERVPIDVLSHDTYEAAALRPLYAKSYQLLEEPCGNYVTWDIRETRWNRGELILSHYFFPHTLGKWFFWMMTIAQKKSPSKYTLRTETTLEPAAAYIAHSALRHIFLKPALLGYILIRSLAAQYLYYEFAPIITMMILIIVIPKIPIIRWNNIHYIMLETICSILQFTPEPIIGTMRAFKACRAHITGRSGWTPQFKVEQDFLISPAIVASFSYQWKIFLCIMGVLLTLYFFKPKDYLLQFLLIVTAFLPIYTTLTAFPYRYYTGSPTRTSLKLLSGAVLVVAGFILGVIMILGPDTLHLVKKLG